MLCRESIWTCWALSSTARAIGMADKSPTAPIMAMVISPMALSTLVGPAEWSSDFLYHVTFDPVGSVSSLCLMCSNSLIRKSSCFNSVAHAEFNVQNASSMGFMADLIWECMPAMVLSHRSFVVSRWDVSLKVRRH